MQIPPLHILLSAVDVLEEICNVLLSIQQTRNSTLSSFHRDNRSHLLIPLLRDTKTEIVLK